MSSLHVDEFWGKKRGLFGTENSRESEKGGLIYPTLISYLSVVRGSSKNAT